MLHTPVLYIVFNRLDTVQQTFQRIRAAQPEQLFIAADGARRDRPGEQTICNNVRSWILANIDWKCNVNTLFREENLGCGKAVSSAITWFFQNIEQGIILEDDCLPSLSFFTYCEELLEYYKDDRQVMHITGDNPLTECADCQYSYYFSPIQHCWGWATWKNRWNLYQYTLTHPDIVSVLKTNPYFSHWVITRYWEKRFQEFTTADAVHTWDFQWVFAILKAGGLCINPARNLVTNIGFLNATTHFSDGDHSALSRSSFELKKIVHPPVKEINLQYIKRINRISFGIDTSVNSIVNDFYKEKTYYIKKTIKGLIPFTHHD